MSLGFDKLCHFASLFLEAPQTNKIKARGAADQLFTRRKLSSHGSVKIDSHVRL
jgi:hypothetical protein